MQIYIHLLGRKEQELDLSIDRLLYGAPTTDEWKPVVLYLSGPFKPNQGFLVLVTSFELSFFSGEQELARTKNATVLQIDVVDNLETIHVQVSGRTKMATLTETPK